MNAKIFDAMLRHGIGWNPWYFEKYADSPNFPPHNITQIDENHYSLTLAVAGFTEDELSINLQSTSSGPTLIVTGKKTNVVEKCDGTSIEIDLPHKVLYRGIAYRNFSREFLIGENVEVETAKLKNGILEINLVRHIPESQKPKLIPIMT
jgi:molecular chaperone IbpA